MIKNIIKNCILLILSIVFSLSIIEIFLSSLKLYQVDLRRYENKNILYNHIQKKNLSFDKRTLFEVYRDFKEKKNYLPKVPPSIQFESLLTFGNISNSKIIGCNENGKYTLWKSDRYGFRNTDELIEKFYFQQNLDKVNKIKSTHKVNIFQRFLLLNDLGRKSTNVGYIYNHKLDQDLTRDKIVPLRDEAK